MRRWIALAATFIVIALVVAGVLGLRSVRGAERGAPTARVVRGDLSLDLTVEGEIRTPRTAMLVAPFVGGSLQLVTLLQTGATVKAGEVVAEFDPNEQEYNLEQSRFELMQAEQEITRMKADNAVQEAQDQVGLLRARFAVRRAELDVKGNELVSAIDAQKNVLALEEARRAFTQLEQDVKSHAASNKAALAVLEERRNKARLAMDVAQKNIENMTVRSPIDGLVVIRENMDSTGGMFMTGMTVPEYREGDNVSPGRPLATVVDVTGLEITAKVNEVDRSTVQPGQSVVVRTDALARKPLDGKVKGMGGLAARGFFVDTSTARQFDATFQLERADPRLRPGMSAQVEIAGQRLKGVLHLPRQAVFERDGKSVVYVKSGDRMDRREVKVKFRTATRVVIEGVAEGTEVALVNPEQEGTGGKAAPPPSAPGGGGGGGVRITVSQ
ncbi:MAG: efflux RND transporter periplasmic adaptor subunit [Bacteroidales bacterium]